MSIKLIRCYLSKGSFSGENIVELPISKEDSLSGEYSDSRSAICSTGSCYNLDKSEINPGQFFRDITVKGYVSCDVVDRNDGTYALNFPSFLGEYIVINDSTLSLLVKKW